VQAQVLMPPKLSAVMGAAVVSNPETHSTPSVCITTRPWPAVREAGPTGPPLVSFRLPQPAEKRRVR
jgi:hypothetical protein